MTSTIFAILIAVLWLIGTSHRIYRQARFFQIEEYMNLRYLRWLGKSPHQWLVRRPLIAGASGLVIGLFVGDTIWVTGGLLIALTLITVYPTPLGEVKKGFTRTQRATRLLATAFITVALLAWIITTQTQQIASDDLRLVSLYGLGFLLWFIAPIMLVIANVLMIPVEEAIRAGYRRQARQKLAQIRPTVIGITGSYGKTSTKTYIAHILNGKYRAFPTPKSWNTIMGVTLAINTRMEPGTEYFICEMGAYVRGEIKGISKLTHPKVGIVTEVGPQHLERFGSLQNIAIAKYEIIQGLPPDGVGVFNWDNPYIREMVEREYPQTRLTVSRQPLDSLPANEPRFVASDEQEDLNGLRFTITDRQSGESVAVETQLVGQHNVTNILIAVAVAVHEGMTLAEVARRIRTLEPAEARLVPNTLPNGLTLINDAYSANPQGAVSALRVLGMYTEGRRLLVTPGMVELGELHEAENQKLGEVAAQYTTDVILVGEAQTRPIYEGLKQANFPLDKVQIVDTVTEAIQWYQQHLGQGDAVLLLNDLPDTY
jgi:UDP-N-acetylmuramoyl-tripeptide--D-alanyl-D-alanine ligase